MNNIDKSFKNAFEEFNDPVTKGHWKKISGAIITVPKKRSFKFWTIAALAVIAGISATAFITILVVKSNEEPIITNVQETKQDGTKQEAIAFGDVKSEHSVTESHQENSKVEFVTKYVKPESEESNIEKEIAVTKEDKGYIIFPINMISKKLKRIIYNYRSKPEVSLITKKMILKAPKIEKEPKDGEKHLKDPFPFLISFTAGVNRMNTKIDYTSNLETYHKDFKEVIAKQNPVTIGYMAGVKFQVHLFRRFSLQTGFEHTMFKQKINYQYTMVKSAGRDSATNKIYGYFDILPAGQKTIDISRTNIYRFIEIPLQINYMLPLRSKKLMVTLNPGASVCHLNSINNMQVDTNSITLYSSKNEDFPPQTASFRKTGYNLSLSATAWYKVHKHIAVGIEPIYIHSLTKFYSTETYTTHNRNVSIRLNAAYTF